MHGTGLTVNEATRSEFNRLSTNASCLFVKFQIAEETFVVRGHGQMTDSRENDFLEMQKALDNQPCFLVARCRGLAEEKWMLVFYMPDGAIVKDRMVYAASTAALRQGLGQGMFTANVYNCTHKSEMSVRDYDRAMSTGNDKAVMTREERLKEDSEFAAHLSMSQVKVSAIVGLPVKADEKAVQAIKDVADKKFNTVVLSMHPDAEVLMVERTGNSSLDEFSSLVPPAEPRYVLHAFPHEHPENPEDKVDAFIFIYYCPDKIKPKLKMFYSTCKSMVVKMCETLMNGVSPTKSLEVSDVKDISVKQTMEELYPKQDEKKMFKKPQTGAKGGKKFLGGGFKA